MAVNGAFEEAVKDTRSSSPERRKMLIMSGVSAIAHVTSVVTFDPDPNEVIPTVISLPLIHSTPLMHSQALSAFFFYILLQ